MGSHRAPTSKYWRPIGDETVALALDKLDNLAVPSFCANARDKQSLLVLDFPICHQRGGSLSPLRCLEHGGAVAEDRALSAAPETLSRGSWGPRSERWVQKISKDMTFFAGLNVRIVLQEVAKDANFVLSFGGAWQTYCQRR